MVEQAESQTLYQHVLMNKIYVAQNIDSSTLGDEFLAFETAKVLRYFPFCDDFGPMNMSCVVKFIELLDAKIAESRNRKVVYCVVNGRQALTNAGNFCLLRYCDGEL